MFSERPTLTRDEIDILVEVARIFMDPETGEVPRVTVKAWDAELETWWRARPESERFQASRAPRAARR